jgi:hypothetical protein
VRVTLGRAVPLAAVVQIGVEWLAWTVVVGGTSPGWLGPAAMAARATLHAAVAAVAVHRGRRWSAPLASVASALMAGVLWILGGILSGQFLGRGFGPGAALGWLVVLLLFAGASGIAGAVAAATTTARHTPRAAG